MGGAFIENHDIKRTDNKKVLTVKTIASYRVITCHCKFEWKNYALALNTSLLCIFKIQVTAPSMTQIQDFKGREQKLL